MYVEYKRRYLKKCGYLTGTDPSVEKYSRSQWEPEKEMYTGLEQLEVKKIMTDFFHFLDDLSLLMYKYGIHLYFWCI